MATLKIHIDDDTKTAADTILGVYGLNIEVAVAEFLANVIKQKNIPFFISGTEYASADDKERVRRKRLATKGSLKGEVWMSDDFDAPLEEMKEYME